MRRSVAIVFDKIAKISVCTVLLLLIPIALAALVGCLFILLGYDFPRINIGLELSPQERIELLPQIGLMVGVFIGAGSLFLQLLSLRAQRSRLLMPQVERQIAEVLNLAHRKSNRRIDWISAELCLTRAETLGLEIKDPSYRNEYKRFIKKSREDLYYALHIRDTENGTYTPLPGKFLA